MHKRRLLTRLGSGTLAVGLAVGMALLTAGVTNAAPPPGTLGSLTITPSTGTDLTAPTARTSAPCPTTANAANMDIIGPVGATDPTFPANNPFPIVTTTSAPGTFSTTDPFDLRFELFLRDAAADRGKTIQAGEYHLTARCIRGLTGQVFGTFTGAMFFTSPTAYTTTDPNAPPSPSPSPVVSPSPSPPPVSPSPPPPSPSPSPSPVVSPSPSPPPPGGATASEVISVNVLAGALTITVANQQVTLPAPTLNPTGTLLSTTGSLNPVTVTDARAGDLGWNVSGQVSAFTNGPASINGGNLGWSPSIVDKAPAQTITTGPVVPPANGIAPGATPPPGVGLASSRTLASAAAGAGIGTANLTAGLALNAPTSTTAGTYTATLTLTTI